MVYADNDDAIKVAESFKTTPEEDALIKKHLEQQIGKTGSYNVLFNNCRTYSNGQYNEMVRMIIKKRVKDKANNIINTAKSFLK